MLVLSRHPGEQVVLEIPPSPYPRQVVLTQVRVNPNTSRIGIDAPDDINIRRAELAERTAEPAVA